MNEFSILHRRAQRKFWQRKRKGESKNNSAQLTEAIDAYETLLLENKGVKRLYIIKSIKLI